METNKHLDPRYSVLSDVPTKEERINKFLKIRKEVKENLKYIETNDDLFYDGYEDDFLLLRSLTVLETSYLPRVVGDNTRFKTCTGSDILSSCLGILMGAREIQKLTKHEYFKIYDDLEREWFNLALKYYSSNQVMVDTIRDMIDLFDKFEEAWRVKHGCEWDGEKYI